MCLFTAWQLRHASFIWLVVPYLAGTGLSAQLQALLHGIRPQCLQQQQQQLLLPVCDLAGTAEKQASQVNVQGAAAVALVNTSHRKHC
jgi:hypothetical protein